jgi:hypothetical protein
MDKLRPEDLAQRVVAWHNRHPLARRITPAQVQGLGWVALPFVQRGGAAASGAASVPPTLPLGELPVLTEPASQAAAPPHRLRDRVRQRLAAKGPAPAATPAAGAPAPLQHWLQGLRQGWQRGRSLRQAFSEDFIAPISPAQAARWALRYGQPQAGTAGQPLRVVLLDPAWARQDAAVQRLFVPTAALEVGARRRRLLLSPQGAVLGRRLLSPLRSAVAASPLLVAALALVLPPLGTGPWPSFSRGGEETLAQAEAAASAVPAAASAAAAASAPPPMVVALAEPPQPVDEPVAWPVPAAPEEPPPWSPSPADEASRLPAGAEPASSAPEALPPDDPPPEEPAPREAAEPDEPRGGPVLRPLSRDAKAAARRAVNEARVASGLPPLQLVAPRGRAAPAGGLRLAQAADLPASAAPPEPLPEIGPVWALSTRVLRTRAESEQVQSAVRGLLAQHTREPLMVELMPVGDDWRVVCWPFLRREDAQLARALLLTRGLRMEAVEF